MKNLSYVGISFIVLIFGIWAVPKIVAKFKKQELYTVGLVPDFSLINQNKKTITPKDLQGKVYVVEFFFSTCPTICPIMNQNMKQVQSHFASNPNFSVVSITIDPKTDTSEVLKKHSEQLGITSQNWHFLTGDQTNIFEIANKGFNLYAGQNSQVAGGFEHSGLVALVDKKGNIRCRKDAHDNPIIYYDGLDKKGVSDLKKDIEILLNE